MGMNKEVNLFMADSEKQGESRSTGSSKSPSPEEQVSSPKEQVPLQQQAPRPQQKIASDTELTNVAQLISDILKSKHTPIGLPDINREGKHYILKLPSYFLIAVRQNETISLQFPPGFPLPVTRVIIARFKQGQKMVRFSLSPKPISLQQKSDTMELIKENNLWGEKSTLSIRPPVCVLLDQEFKEIGVVDYDDLKGEKVQDEAELIRKITTQKDIAKLENGIPISSNWMYCKKTVLIKTSQGAYEVSKGGMVPVQNLMDYHFGNSKNAFVLNITRSAWGRTERTADFFSHAKTSNDEVTIQRTNQSIENDWVKLKTIFQLQKFLEVYGIEYKLLHGKSKEELFTMILIKFDFFSIKKIKDFAQRVYKAQNGKNKTYPFVDYITAMEYLMMVALGQWEYNNVFINGTFVTMKLSKDDSSPLTFKKIRETFYNSKQTCDNSVRPDIKYMALGGCAPGYTIDKITGCCKRNENVELYMREIGLGTEQEYKKSLEAAGMEGKELEDEMSSYRTEYNSLMMLIQEKATTKEDATFLSKMYLYLRDALKNGIESLLASYNQFAEAMDENFLTSEAMQRGFWATLKQSGYNLVAAPTNIAVGVAKGAFGLASAGFSAILGFFGGSKEYFDKANEFLQMTKDGGKQIFTGVKQVVNTVKDLAVYTLYVIWVVFKALIPYAFKLIQWILANPSTSYLILTITVEMKSELCKIIGYYVGTSPVKYSYATFYERIFTASSGFLERVVRLAFANGHNIIAEFSKTSIFDNIFPYFTTGISKATGYLIGLAGSSIPGIGLIAGQAINSVVDMISKNAKEIVKGALEANAFIENIRGSIKLITKLASIHECVEKMYEATVIYVGSEDEEKYLTALAVLDDVVLEDDDQLKRKLQAAKDEKAAYEDAMAAKEERLNKIQLDYKRKMKELRQNPVYIFKSMSQKLENMKNKVQTFIVQYEHIVNMIPVKLPEIKPFDDAHMEKVFSSISKMRAYVQYKTAEYQRFARRRNKHLEVEGFYSNIKSGIASSVKGEESVLGVAYKTTTGAVKGLGNAIVEDVTSDIKYIGQGISDIGSYIMGKANAVYNTATRAVNAVSNTFGGSNLLNQSEGIFWFVYSWDDILFYREQSCIAHAENAFPGIWENQHKTEYIETCKKEKNEQMFQYELTHNRYKKQHEKKLEADLKPYRDAIIKLKEYTKQFEANNPETRIGKITSFLASTGSAISNVTSGVLSVASNIASKITSSSTLTPEEEKLKKEQEEKLKKEQEENKAKEQELSDTEAEEKIRKFIETAKIDQIHNYLESLESSLTFKESPFNFYSTAYLDNFDEVKGEYEKDKSKYEFPKTKEAYDEKYGLTAFVLQKDQPKELTPEEKAERQEAERIELENLKQKLVQFK